MTTTDKPWTRQTIAEMRTFAAAQSPPISLDGLTRKVDIHSQIERAMMLRDAAAESVPAPIAASVPTREPEDAQASTQPLSGRADGRDADEIMDAWRAGEAVDADAENIIDQARERASTALVPLRMPSPARWAQMREMSNDVATSAIVRAKKLNRPEDVLVVALAAHDLGVSFTMALQQIHVIDGKPSMSGQMMIALVRQAGYAITPLEMTDTRAVAKGVRGAEEVTFEFTIDEAIQAELVSRVDGKLRGKDNWVHYPKTMLWWRAVAGVGRILFPDVLGGLTYTPEELGANVNNEGAVIDVDSWDVTPTAAPDPGDERAPADCGDHDGSGLCCLKIIQQRSSALPDAVKDIMREEWDDARKRGDLVPFRELQRKHLTAVGQILHDAEATASQMTTTPAPPCNDDADIDALAALGAQVVHTSSAIEDAVVVSPLLNADDPGGRELTAQSRAREIAEAARARENATPGACITCGKPANSKDPDYCKQCEPF